MNQDEEKQIHSSYDYPDRLTSFMFGEKRGYRNEEKKEDDFPRSNKGDWILGTRFKEYDERDNRNDNSTLSNLLNGVNMEELFQNLDTLMETASQFKPLWKKISPFIQKWKK